MIITFNTIEEVKAYAKQQLEKTDYTVLSDVRIANKFEFERYRSEMRDAYFNPRINFQFFPAPKAIWEGPENVPQSRVQP
jgi:hypothetical protein